MKFLSDLDLGQVCHLNNTLLQNANGSGDPSAGGSPFGVPNGSANQNQVGLIAHYNAKVYYYGSLNGSGSSSWYTLARSIDLPNVSANNRIMISDGSGNVVTSPDWGVSGNDIDLGVSSTKRRIINLNDPINDYDAANKRYVDSVASGLTDFKASCVFTTTANVGGTFSAVPIQATIIGASQAAFETPGITVTIGMRVLVKNQTAAAQNGIYEITNISGYSTYDLQRTLDANSTGELTDGCVVYVEKGPTYGQTTWVVSNSGMSPILNTDAINWVLFSQVTGLGAGAGLSMTGNVIDVNVDNVTTYIASDIVKVRGSTSASGYDVLLTGTPGAGNAAWGKLDLGTGLDGGSAQYVTGTLTVGNGGTGRNTLTANNIIYGNGTSTVGLAAPAANSVLWANSGAPSFTSQPTLGTGIITKGQVAVRIDPYNTVAGNTGEIQFLELAANGANYVGFKAPDSIASNKVWVLPAADGSANYFMKTDGAGNLAFAQVTAAMIGSGAAISPGTADANVTIGITGGSAAVLSATTVTIGWSGLLSVARGGTNTGTVTQYAVALGGSGGYTWSSVGTGGQLFVGQGAAANPTFVTMSGDATLATGGALTISANAVTYGKIQTMAALSVLGNATNAVATPSAITGTANQVLCINAAGTAVAFSTVNLASTAAVTGTLPVGNGGTGATTFTANGVLYGNTTSAVQVTAQGGADTVLTANAGAPSFSGQPSLATGIITKGQNAVQINPFNTAVGNTGEIRFLELAANGTNYVGFKAPDTIAANKVWVLPAADGSANYFMKTDGAGNLAFAQVTASMVGSGAALTKTDDTNVTLTLGGTPASALLTAASITVGWSGLLSVARGGTNSGTVTQYAVAIGGSGGYTWTAVGTAGQMLLGQGAAANPVFTSMSGEGTLTSGGVFALASTATPTIKKLTLTYGTNSGASDPVFVATQTWNNAATTFTGVSWSFTTTASQSASLLFNLLAGASPVSVFSIRQDGYTTVAAGLTVPLIKVTSGTSNGIIDVTNNLPLITFSGVASAVNYLTVTNAISGNPLQLSVGSSSANNANLQLNPALTGSDSTAWGAITWKDNVTNASTQVLRLCRAWAYTIDVGAIDRAGNTIVVTWGVTTSFDITHDFGTEDIVVIFTEVSTGQRVMTDWIKKPGSTKKTITVSFKAPPAAGAYRVTIIG